MPITKKYLKSNKVCKVTFKLEAEKVLKKQKWNYWVHSMNGNHPKKQKN